MLGDLFELVLDVVAAVAEPVIEVTAEIVVPVITEVAIPIVVEVVGTTIDVVDEIL